MVIFTIIIGPFKKFLKWNMKIIKSEAITKNNLFLIDFLVLLGILLNSSDIFSLNRQQAWVSNSVQ